MRRALRDHVINAAFWHRLSSESHDVVMEPLSISSAIGGLVTVCGQAITTCRAIVSSMQDAPRILSSIQAECSTTREALSNIFILINKSDTTALTHLSSNATLSQS